MSKPRTLQQYVEWFVEWAGGEGSWPWSMCVDTVMKIARKKGYRLSVEPTPTGYEGFVWSRKSLNGYSGSARREPIYAALRALHKAVMEEKK